MNNAEEDSEEEQSFLADEDDFTELSFPCLVDKTNWYDAGSVDGILDLQPRIIEDPNTVFDRQRYYEGYLRGQQVRQNLQKKGKHVTVGATEDGSDLFIIQPTKLEEDNAKLEELTMMYFKVARAFRETQTLFERMSKDTPRSLDIIEGKIREVTALQRLLVNQNRQLQVPQVQVPQQVQAFQQVPQQVQQQQPQQFNTQKSKEGFWGEVLNITTMTVLGTVVGGVIGYGLGYSKATKGFTTLVGKPDTNNYT